MLGSWKPGYFGVIKYFGSIILKQTVASSEPPDREIKHNDQIYNETLISCFVFLSLLFGILEAFFYNLSFFGEQGEFYDPDFFCLGMFSRKFRTFVQTFAFFIFFTVRIMFITIQ